LILVQKLASITSYHFRLQVHIIVDLNLFQELRTKSKVTN
jgi:hypothetical protein